MKAVILAAGRGTRMGSLSEDVPKPMLTVLGKTLLEYKLDSLPEEIHEVIIVVGYLKEKIIDRIGDNYRGRKIIYVIQNELRGTAHALFLCKQYLNDRFIVMMGDDIYTREDIEACCKNDFSILVYSVPSMLGKAKVVTDSNGRIIEIREKNTDDSPGFVCTGMYSLTPAIFSYEMVPISDKEFGLPQTILSARNEISIQAVESRTWFQITTPEDLVKAEELFTKERRN